jgi:hypothetical protein
MGEAEVGAADRRRIAHARLQSLGFKAPTSDRARNDCGGAISGFRTVRSYVKYKHSSLERLEIYFRAAQNFAIRNTRGQSSIARLQ